MSAKCTKIENEFFSLYQYADGRCLLMPPPGWIVRLVEFELSGVVSHHGAVETVAEWRRRMWQKITSP